jgi:hypothetical protein
MTFVHYDKCTELFGDWPSKGICSPRPLDQINHATASAAAAVGFPHFTQADPRLSRTVSPGNRVRIQPKICFSTYCQLDTTIEFV